MLYAKIVYLTKKSNNILQLKRQFLLKWKIQIWIV